MKNKLFFKKNCFKLKIKEIFLLFFCERGEVTDSGAIGS